MFAPNDYNDVGLKALCPHIPDTAVVENLLKVEYGLTTISLTPLNGYDDRNYLARVNVKTCNPFLNDVDRGEFFVKVVNSKDSKMKTFCHSQRLVMKHLNKHGIVCQEEIKNLDGKYFSRVTIVNSYGIEESHIVSVRTFLPGTVMCHHIVTPPLLYDLGMYLARVHNALKDFHADFYDTFDCTWSLNNVPTIRSAVRVVQDNDTRKLVLDILDTFDRQVLCKKDKFRTAQIHGDPNEQNILLIPDDNAISGFAISGLLDFQDTARTHPVYDLAILCCYMAMVPRTDVAPLDAMGHILSGYLSQADLCADERACLRTLIASRMCMSLVYGLYTYVQNPENDYVIVTAEKGWKVMSEFWLTSEEKVKQRWDYIIQINKPKINNEQLFLAAKLTL